MPKTRTPTLPSVPPAVEPEGAGALVEPQGLGVDDLLASLQATGASRWEAIGLAAQVVGRGALQPLWDTSGAKIPEHRWDLLLRMLDEVAAGSPPLANAWLGDWLAGLDLESTLDLRNRSWVTGLDRPFTMLTNSLFLQGTGIMALPAGLKVGGTLDLGGTPLERLPEGLWVGNRLNLRDCPLRELPPNLYVGGVLDLRDTQVTALREDLQVGSLCLKGLPITSWPEGLRTLGNVDLQESLIESLPAGFRVDGYLHLHDTPIRSLPAGLVVEAGLFLSKTRVATLPAGLIVGGDLALTGCATWDGCIPADAKLEGDLRTDAHPDGIGLGRWRSLHPRGERG